MSLIGWATVRSLGGAVGRELDPRQFRPNVLVETVARPPHLEDAWVGGRLTFGRRSDSARIRVDRRDPRCMMINLDPETAEQQPAVLKEVVRSRDTCAGIYCTPEQPGTIRVGDAVYLTEAR